MTVTANIIPVSFPSANLADKKKCLDNQIRRQRHLSVEITGTFPHKPYCTNSLKSGLVVRPLLQALRKPYLEINPPSLVTWLTFDIDRDNAAFAWQDVFGLKIPHLATINPENGHAHLSYRIISVCRSDAGRLAPLRLMAALQYTYTLTLGADPGYAGLITKNPLHPHWGLLIWRDLSKPYSLGEMAENVDLQSPPKRPEVATGLGRNCAVFDSARVWAYKAVRNYWRPGGLPDWKEAVKTQCEGINGLFPTPLPDSEIRATAKSIADFCWKRITPDNQKALIARTHTPEIQSERGKKNRPEKQAEKGRKGGLMSGEVRREASEDKRSSARLLKASGKTVREIAKTLGVPSSTAGFWCR